MLWSAKSLASIKLYKYMYSPNASNMCNSFVGSLIDEMLTRLTTSLAFTCK